MPSCPYKFDPNYEQLRERLYNHFIKSNVKISLHEPDGHAFVFSNMVPSSADSGNRVGKTKEIEKAWDQIHALAKEIEGLVIDKCGCVFSFKFYFDSEDTKSLFLDARTNLRKARDDYIARLPDGPPSWEIVRKFGGRAWSGDW
jgi:hypothetical protein